MATSELRLDDENPYPGPPSFEERHQDFFFGRDEEKQAVFDLVRRANLTVLFGKSGTGKSSLLRAGAFPLLRAAGHFPIAVRFLFGAEAPKLRQQVRESIGRAIREYPELQAEEPSSERTLWEYFHRTPFWGRNRELLMPVLVLDQFEEALRSRRNQKDFDGLIEELADVAENRIPEALLSSDEKELPARWKRAKVRLLISLREDFLPQLEDLRPLLPSVAVYRYRLKELTGTSAVRAVTLGGRAKIVKERDATSIVGVVAGLSSARPDGTSAPVPPTPLSPEELEGVEVHPALLSLFCCELNERRKARHVPMITPALIGETSDLLPGFYRRCLQGLGARVGRYLQDTLLDADGHRTSVPIANFRRDLGRSEDDVTVDTGIIQPLVERRLLAQEARYGTVHVELVHDVMAQVLGAERRARKQRRRHLWFGLAVLGSIVLAGAAAIYGALASGRADKADQRERDARVSQAAGLVRAASRAADPTRAALILAEIGDLPSPIPEAAALARARNLLSSPSADAVLEGHVDAITSIDFSPDGKSIVSASADGTARVWRVDGRGQPQILVDGKDATFAEVDLARFSTSGHYIISGVRDGRLLSWSVQPDGIRLAHEVVEEQADLFRGYRIVDMKFSHRGNQLLVRAQDFNPKPQSKAPFGAHIRLVDYVEGKALTGWRHTPTPILDGAFDPNGYDMVFISQDGGLRPWTQKGWSHFADSNLPENREVQRAAFSPDARTVASLSKDGTVRLWRFDRTDHAVILGPFDWALANEGKVPELGFGNGVLAIATDDGVRVLSSSDAGIEAGFRYFERVGAHGSVMAIGSKAVAIGSAEGDITCWSLDGKAWPTFSTGGSQVRGLKFNGAGDTLAAFSADRKIRIWRLKQNDLPAEWNDVATLARRSTTACLSPSDRVLYLSDEPPDAEKAFAACESKFGRAPLPAIDPTTFQPFASAVDLGTKMNGRPSYEFTLGLRGPLDALGRIERVVYWFNSDAFNNPERVATPPDLQVKYKGWGCVDDVVARVIFKDRSTIKVPFSACKLLGW